jgi:hypothetical protein
MAAEGPGGPSIRPQRPQRRAEVAGDAFVTLRTSAFSAVQFIGTAVA